MALAVTPIQIIFGDLHGLNTLQHQPAKIAAMEGIWETEKGAAFRLFAVPNEREEKNDYSLEIPYLTSLILTHSFDGEVKGLKAWPEAERPPVAIVFYSFRIMIGLGILMMLTGIIALILFLKQKLFTNPWFLKWCLWLTPSGFIALLAGWFVTEVGRQPYVVYGALKTTEAASKLYTHQLVISLTAFVVVYLFVFSMGIYYMLRLIKKGPKHVEDVDVYGEHGVKQPLTLADIFHLRK
jgi:cytochrome d ubiquinol oxidase subunit I